MSTRIPQSFLDELLNQTDLVELVDHYVPLKRQGSSFVACCPFHNEKTPSFHVIPQKQFFYCFGCGASGNAISFAIDYLHLGFIDAVKTLAERLGLEVPHDEAQTTKQVSAKPLYELLNDVAAFYEANLKQEGQVAIDYLKKRGLTGTITKHYQLGYTPPNWHTLEQHFKSKIDHLIATGMLIKRDDGKIYDRYRDRIMFPIHNRHGQIIGFGGRAITPEQEPKYLNSPETSIFQKNRELYGLYQILQQKKSIDYILVVEGYMDVIALAQYGIHNAVATLGTATSAYHIQLLFRHTKRVIFAFDGDPAGKKAAWRALENALPLLNQGLDARFMFLPEGQDPDSLIRTEQLEAFNNRLAQAMPLNQFFFNELSQSIDLNNIAGKSQLVNAAKPYLEKLGDGPYQQLFLDELGRLTHLDSHRLEQLTQIKQSAVTPSSDHQNISRTPIRIIIALLLQHPEIVDTTKEQLTQALVDKLQEPTIQTMLTIISKKPDINTAMLIEHWRDKPEFSALAKLASWDHQVPKHALATEFLDTVFFLIEHYQKKKINELIAKARSTGLTKEEQQELQTMLRARHQDTVDPN